MVQYEPIESLQFNSRTVKENLSTCELGLAVLVDTRSSERERAQTIDYLNLHGTSYLIRSSVGGIARSEYRSRGHEFEPDLKLLSSSSLFKK